MARSLIAVLVTILTLEASYSQTSGEQYHESAIIHGNRVMTSFGNWGVIGEPAPLGSRAAWIYPTNGYIGDLSLLVGIELPIRDYNGDGIPDTVHSVITCNVDRPTPATDTDPATGKFWTFEPENGFANPASGSPAIRSRPATWPSIWPDHPEWGSGHWNGLHGPDSISGDDEAYFRMDDRNDARFNVASNNSRGIAFRPDSTDLTRGGAGISVGVRYIQSAQLLYQDIFFRVCDIRNEGTTNYDKVVFGTLNGTYVGVTSTEDYEEYNNDCTIYFSSSEFMLTANYPEYTMKNPFWLGPVGMFGEAFAESPAGLHVASYDGIVPSNQVVLGNDESLWNRLRPGSYVNPQSVVQDTIPTAGEDMDYMYGSGFFSLKAGETKRMVTVLAYGYTKEEIRQKIFLARALWNSGFVPGSVTASAVLQDFPSHRFLSGLQVVHWTTARPGGTVSFWFSPDAGSVWKAVALGIPNTGSALWNTADFPDAAFGVLRVFASDTAGRVYGMGESGSYITLNNSHADTPFVKILTTGLESAGVITGPSLDLSILCGDPSWGNLNISLSYRSNASSTFIPFDAFVAPSDTLPRIHTVSLKDLPNSATLQIKATVSGPGGAWSDSTPAFNKQTPRPEFPTGGLQFRGLAQIPFRISIEDSSRVRPDTYVITFNDTSAYGPKTFSVFDRTRGISILGNTPFYPRIESAPFDGLTLYTEDTTTVIDSSRTRFNRIHAGVTWNLQMAPLGSLYGSEPGYRQPYDYVIAFSNRYIDTTQPFTNFYGYQFPPVPVKSRIVNAATGGKVIQAGTGLESLGFAVFLEDVAGTMRPTWSAFLSYLPPDSLLLGGDTLFVFTKKGLSYHDTLTVNGIVLSVGPARRVPSAYALYQNYPNPFNPSTRIGYDLPSRTFVRLTVFDILGQRVAQLVDGVETAGIHSVEWRGVSDSGAPVATGVYFCRLDAGPVPGTAPAFSKTMKMLYLK